MEILNIRGSDFLLRASAEEQSDGRSGLSLISGAFLKLGQKRGRRIFAEAFEGKDETLIFVRSSSEPPVFFEFSDAEELFGAANAWNGDAPSSLWYADGKYILAVWPWQKDAVCASPAEFGQLLSMPPEFEYHLSEHGQLLASPYALDELKV